MTRFYSLLLLAATTLQSGNAFSSSKLSAEGNPEVNKNGVPFGTPDKEIKCAFFRILNPRTDKYVNFREDLDAGGLDPDLTDEAGWPLIYIQQGHDKSMNEGVGLDTLDLDGYLNGVLSHEDLMWPHRDEIADLLKTREAEDGTITPADLFDAKQLAAEKNNMDTPTFASYNEIPIAFLISGGDPDTGKVQLTSMLDFFNGIPPSTRGRVTREGINKVIEILTATRQPSPSPIKSILRSALKYGVFGRNGVLKFVKATRLVSSGKMKRKLLE